MTTATKLTFDIIEDAFHFVSNSPPGEHSAIVNRATGESFFVSPMAGIDELPDDMEESDDYLAIPHKNELDLGRPLVMEFVRHCCPELTDRIYAIFARRGAYGRYKELLTEKDLLQEWYDFENKRTREALLAWCREEGLFFEEGDE